MSLGVGLILDEYWTWKKISRKVHLVGGWYDVLETKVHAGLGSHALCCNFGFASDVYLVGVVVYARVFDCLRLAWEKPCLFSSSEFFEMSCRH